MDRPGGESPFRSTVNRVCILRDPVYLAVHELPREASQSLAGIDGRRRIWYQHPRETVTSLELRSDDILLTYRLLPTAYTCNLAECHRYIPHDRMLRWLCLFTNEPRATPASRDRPSRLRARDSALLALSLSTASSLRIPYLRLKPTTAFGGEKDRTRAHEPLSG